MTIEEYPQADGSVLRFDTKGHRYSRVTDAGEVDLPSVSAIIKPETQRYYGFGGDGGMAPGVLAHAAERGQAVHEACWFLDQDDLDEESLDEEIVPYVEAYRRFLREANVEIVEIEQPRMTRLGSTWFAGRPDRVVRIKRRGRWSDPSPLDLKATVEMAPAVGLQVAGYGLLMQQPAKALPSPRTRLLALQLQHDGTFRLHDFTASAARLTNHFRALLVTHTYGGSK